MGYWDENCSDVPGHMTKMASRPIYGKILQKCPSLESRIGIPVMRYDRAARPCALNFRLAALKCRFGRPPNALSSVGV